MPVWTITAKDLYLLARDRRTIAVLVMLPLVFIVIIGLTTGKLLGWRSSNQTLKIAAVDAIDYDAIGSAEFMTPPDAAPGTTAPFALTDREREVERNRAGHIVADVLNGMQKDAGVEVRTAAGWDASLARTGPKAQIAGAERLAADSQVNAALIFLPDFYRKVYPLSLEDLGELRGLTPNKVFERIGVRVIHENPESSTASALNAIVSNQLFVGSIVPIEACESRGTSIGARASVKYRKNCGPINEMGMTPPPPLDPPTKNVGEGGNRVYQELVPSYTVMFVFFLVNIMARSFLVERELGTMRRLRIAPVSPSSVLLGKTLPFLVVSLVQTAILFGAGKLLFGMSWGTQPWMLLPVIFTTSCAATGLGLLIATLVKSDSQVSAYATTAVIVLAGVSGCFMPRKWLPDLMQEASLATPHAWALIAYDQLLSTPTPNLTTVWQSVGMLAAFAAAFLLLGAWRFRAAD